MKTSQTHPLQIAEVPAASGAIGITFCPGKQQRSAFSGQWSRDLAIDLDVIRDWGAAAVVTLVEDHELISLKVQHLGSAVQARHMAWHHLPIRDVSVPCGRSEAQWQEQGEALRRLLRHGFKVLVHCKGGLGRAGTIAARLLAELGTDPAEAISMVRSVRPGAIETEAQRRHVLKATPVPEKQSDTSIEAIRDRAVGALLDAIALVPNELVAAMLALRGQERSARAGFPAGRVHDLAERGAAFQAQQGSDCGGFARKRFI